MMASWVLKKKYPENEKPAILHKLDLRYGFDILSGPTIPIIGEGKEEANDRYVEQLVASAEAAVEEVIRR